MINSLADFRVQYRIYPLRVGCHGMLQMIFSGTRVIIILRISVFLGDVRIWKTDENNPHLRHRDGKKKFFVLFNPCMAFVRCRSLNLPSVIMLLLATTYFVTLLLTFDRHPAGELNF